MIMGSMSTQYLTLYVARRSSSHIPYTARIAVHLAANPQPRKGDIAWAGVRNKNVLHNKRFR